MANSTQTATSDGTMVLLDISIDYLDRSEITVYFNGALTTAWAWVGTTEKRISFSPAVPNLTQVLVKRTTDLAELRHSFSLGAAFTAQTLDEDLEQILHIAQEASEGNLGGDFFTDINMHAHKITNVADAVNPQDAVPLGQVSDIAEDIVDAAISAALAAKVSKGGDTLSGALTPAVDNGTDLGAIALRWAEVYTKSVSDGVASAAQLLGSSSDQVRVGFGSSWSSVAFFNGGVEAARVQGGNVGIGVVPSYRLHVSNPGLSQAILALQGAGAFLHTFSTEVSSNAVNGARVMLTSQSNSGEFSFANAVGEKLRIDYSGNVLVNTIAPVRSGKLTVVADGSALNGATLADSRAYSAQPLAQLSFAAKYNSAGTYADIAAVRGTKANSTDGSQLGLLQFYVNAGSAAVEMMRLDSSGNVGIGTSAPTARLHVFGDIKFQAPTSAPALAANLEVSFQLASNTELKVHARGSDGVTRVGSITLS